MIECRAGGVRALHFAASGNTIRFQKYFPTVPFEDIIPFLHGLNVSKYAKAIFVYDRSLAATFSGSVRFERGDGLTPVSDEDFEKFLTQATNQFFNRFREEAKRLFSTDDVNIVLANNRFLSLRLDGKKVVNPIGLRGKAAELEIEQTFLTRQVLSVLHEAAHGVSSLFHIELAVGCSDLAQNVFPDTKIICAIVGGAHTRMYASGAKQRYFGAVSFPKVQERGAFDWGTDRIYEILGKALSLESVSVYSLLDRYAKGDCSRYFSRFIDALLEPEVLLFAQELSRFNKKDERVVIFSEAPFLRERGSLPGFSYEAPGFDQLLEHLGFVVQAPYGFPYEAFSPAFLAGFVAYLRRTGDNYLYALGKERMGWLTPVNSV